MRFYKLFLGIVLIWIQSATAHSVLIKRTHPPDDTVLRKRANITGDRRIDMQLQALQANEVRAILSPQLFAALNAPQNDLVELSKWFSVQIPSTTALDSALNLLQQTVGIDIAVPNRKLTLHFIPNDPGLAHQYHLSNIHAYRGWEIERGSANVLVAVIDTGIDYDHPDLKQNLWINAGEDINGNGVVDKSDFNGIDDDNNGFIDDLRGWDFTDAPDYPAAGDYLGRDNDPADEMGHGTQVAGIIAAVADNNLGIAGIAHGCKVMNLRSFNSRGEGDEDDSAAAILYAVAQGAQIINMSWGDEFITLLLDDVLRYAANRGVMLVASAGNAATDKIHYPSALEVAISVGAVNRENNRAGFSNYGATLDMVAPGVDIYTTTLEAAYDSSSSGTSFSAPMVSAAAALLLSADPLLDADAVRGILMATATDLGTDGFDSYYGAGLLDIDRALRQPNQTIVQITSPRLDQGFSGGPLTITGSAWSPVFESYSVSYGLGENPDEWIDILSGQTEMILDDTLAVWQNLPDQDCQVILKVAVQNRNGSYVESTIRLFIDSSPPEISSLEILPMYDGPLHSVLISFDCDDICQGEILYRPLGSINPFQRLSIPYRTDRLAYKISQSELTGSYQIKIRAINRVGLISEDDNDGRFYRIDLSRPPVNTTLYTQTALEIPSAYLFNVDMDMNNNGHPELVVNPYKDDTFHYTRFYEYINATLQETFSINRRLICRDIGTYMADGFSQLLGGFGQNSYLYVSADAGGFPSQFHYSWEADDENGYWASRLADLDKDNLYEVVMRVTRAAGDTTFDEFRIYEINANNEFEHVASLPNFTSGNNYHGVPHCEFGFFDDDDAYDLIFGDYDGDLYMYECINDNIYTPVWQDSLPLSDTIDFISTGDYDGDGSVEFLAGCHTAENEVNTEHAYDSKHWLFRIYKSTGNNRYSVQTEWRFYGFESLRDYPSGVTSGDTDGDGKDEIVLTLFPDLYIIEYNEFGDYEVSFYHDNIRSNAAIITDADSNGDKEIWVGTGDNTIALGLVGATSAPASPAGVKATPLDSSRISLSWYPVPGADSYELLRGTDTEHLTYHATTADAAFTDADLIAGCRYFYAVVTHDADRPVPKSLPSTPVSAVPGTNPFLVSAAMETDNSVRLVFSEKMNESILEKNNYHPSQQLGSLSSVAADAGGRNVLLSFSRPFAETGTFLISVKDLYSGNRVPIDTDRNSATVNIKKIAGPPYIKSSQLQNNNGLEVIFNEPMQLSTILDTANYDMGSEINIQDITTSGDQYDRVILQLSMKQNFGALGKVYSLKVRQVKNIAGIAIKPGRGDRIQLIFSKTTLDDVFVYPNPYKSGMISEKMTFANLTARATIEIFDLHGRRLCVLYEKDGDGGLVWNLDDENGEKVSSGIYFYRVKADSQTFVGKLAIIR